MIQSIIECQVPFNLFAIAFYYDFSKYSPKKFLKKWVTYSQQETGKYHTHFV